MIRINDEFGFGEGGRPDGVRLQKEFGLTVPATGYSALHGILTKLSTAMTAEGSMDPAVVTIDVMVANLTTVANLYKVAAEL